MLQLQHNLGENSISDEQYERDTSNAIINNSEEIQYTSDDYDNSFVKSRYFTQNQFTIYKKEWPKFFTSEYSQCK